MQKNNGMDLDVTNSCQSEFVPVLCYNYPLSFWHAQVWLHAMLSSLHFLSTAAPSSPPLIFLFLFPL